MTRFPSGPLKRLYIDRKAAAQDLPAIVMQLESGETHHADSAEWNGRTMFVPNPEETAPAYYVATDAEVTLK